MQALDYINSEERANHAHFEEAQTNNLKLFLAVIISES